MDTLQLTIEDTFKLMWELYPAPVLLVHHNRGIVAVNKAAENMGVPVGVKCYQLAGNDTICPKCKGNICLKKREGQRRTSYYSSQKAFADTYWVPVAGEEDLFVHFFNDISEHVRPELLQNK